MVIGHGRSPRAGAACAVTTMIATTLNRVAAVNHFDIHDYRYTYASAQLRMLHYTGTPY